MHLNNGLDIPPRNRDILETSILEILRTYNASMWLAGPGNGEGNYVDSIGAPPRTAVNELVGYVADDMSIEQAENAACNTEFAGATVGLAANALPGYAGVVSAGLLSSIVGVGNGFVDVRFFGTATIANDYLLMEPLASVSKAIAILGEDAIAAVTASYTPGAVQTIPRSILLSCVTRDGANVPLSNSALNITSLLTETPTRFVARARVANATAAVCTLSLRVVAIQIGDVFDFTLRLSDYRIAKGNSDTPVKNTALTPLYRANNYVSLNQATTGFKPILAGGFRSFLANGHNLNTLSWGITNGTKIVGTEYPEYGVGCILLGDDTAGQHYVSQSSTAGYADNEICYATALVKCISGDPIVRFQCRKKDGTQVYINVDLNSGQLFNAPVGAISYGIEQKPGGFWQIRMEYNAGVGASLPNIVILLHKGDSVDATGTAIEVVGAYNATSSAIYSIFPRISVSNYTVDAVPYSWKFDGVDDRFVHTIPPINPNGDHFFIVAFRMPPTPIVDARWVLGLGNAGSGERAGIVFVSNGQVVGFWRDTGAANLNSITLGGIRAVNEKLVATARRNGATFWGSVRGDIGASATGSTAVTVTAWTPTLSVIGAGVSLGTANFFYGAEIYAVIEGNGAPTVGELTAMENFLAGHAGFTPLP